MIDMPVARPGWYLESPTVWARQEPGGRVGFGLLLRVWLDPEATAVADAWTWEVAETSDEGPSEIEVDVGGAASRESAMDKALARSTDFLTTGE